MELDFSKKDYVLLEGDVIDRLKDLDDNSVDCVITSPPYFNLRDYHAEGQIGMEKTPEEYVEKMVDVFREVKRVLKDTGTVWLNIGDSYCNSNGFARLTNEYKRKGREGAAANDRNLDALHEAGYKDKDMIGIPWMLAFALRNDGWYLRQDIIWCLSEFTTLYVKDDFGRVRPMSIRELFTKDYTLFKLWNGSEWVGVTNIRKTEDPRDKIELIMGNGEAIGTTLNHQFILEDGTVVEAKDLKVGDVLMRCDLPDERSNYPFKIDPELLWLCGLYLACGERVKGRYEFHINVEQERLVDRIDSIMRTYGGGMECLDNHDKIIVKIDSDMVADVISTATWGNSSSEKCLFYGCWNLSNGELRQLMTGYFQGIGYSGVDYDGIKIPYDPKNHYWRMNLRSLAARLGAYITVKWIKKNENDKFFSPLMVWHRRKMFDADNDDCKLVRIRDCSAENFYDVSVGDDKHIYTLASGIMTHNCKPNPLPESVLDRCTKAHEYIFLLSKSKKYFFDYEAIEEEATGYDGRKDTMLKGSPKYDNAEVFAGQKPQSMAARGHERWKFKAVKPEMKNIQDMGRTIHSFHKNRAMGGTDDVYAVRRKRDVWNVPTKSFPGAHFATFPEKLVEPCVLAGCPEGGVVLDIFNGAATTGMVALRHGRKYVGIELNPEYVEISRKRIDDEFYNPEYLFN